MTLRKTEEAERAFNRGGQNAKRMVPHLAANNTNLALIALSSCLDEMCTGLAALSVAVRNVYDKE